MTRDQGNYVETVLGPIAPDALEVVLPHEHFPHFMGNSRASAPSREREIMQPPEGYRITFETRQREILEGLKQWGSIRSSPCP